ncbi:hypothetical protein SISNIDRAFT_451283 [Sistotremastrum niveocremeum HHB9708]|uniref:Uncharacterized protein n=1 Tax=Sistotremastrum niveocremeum HHB9708 TaxID=1314777 RepID=A0A164Y346_9AGAM|nr:hypothetical protein SISNIDRAFT_451283 [Sistotremastrum niveocremeum HHB9708]
MTAACCCNYIAFALSMLCLNCQQNVGSLLFAGKDGTGQDTGYLAGAGSFQLYLTNFGQSPQCAPQLNTSFPQNVQQQVCLEGLNIDDNLYSPTNFSPDGSWCQSMASPNYTFKKCADLNIKATITASPLSTSTDSPPNQFAGGSSILPSSPAVLPTGAIVGISVAATLVVCGLIVSLVYFFWRRRVKRQQPNRSMIEEPSAVMDRNASIINQFALPPRSYRNGFSANHYYEHVQNPVEESIVGPSISPPTFISGPLDLEPTNTDTPSEENAKARRQRSKRRQALVNARADSPDDSDDSRYEDGGPLLARVGSSVSRRPPPAYKTPTQS